ncbi:YchF/TatD family DNA exonuclease [Methanothermococcus okinawensis]|uniref:Hydrolase, TatD family n=1 Tax=Methanothermococcus okinawensis (strain DSM 14208 / JCM 11175 / IH1) TaxID=647113 RepID=F8AMT4_METOI|nr:YchF/TatD family DNA exonuclease [Methanothermococcus okinawensis]AEH06915.1 hydrolase, TatD family [Methanothermococcus okinawensis IH1]
MKFKYKYIDAHCHIEDKGFNKNRGEVVETAKNNNVEMITSGANFGGCIRALKFKKEYNIYLTLGFHPGNVNAEDKIIDKVYNLIKQHEKEILGVGEVGLDANVHNIGRQKEIFNKFINLAEELNKPIIIHGRGLERECYNLVNNRVISMFHCYSGDIELAKELIDNNHYISISTLICFSTHHQELVKHLDLENIVVETDSPYLSPIKGEKNQPVNVIKVVEKIYDIKKGDGTYSYDEIVNIIYHNTKKLFNI